MWYQEVLGFNPVERTANQTFDVCAMMHPSGVVVDVATHHETPDEKFDERRVGLDHLSFHVADRQELERGVQHLDSCGVEHSGIIDASWGPTVVFRDPDNIQLELFVPPSAQEIAERLGAAGVTVTTGTPG